MGGSDDEAAGIDRCGQERRLRGEGLNEEEVLSNSTIQGYDIVGDIHGYATELEALLKELGYVRDGVDGAYRHPQRQAIFVGDLIDRGPASLGFCRS